MQDLVKVLGERVTVNSRDVAGKFEKRHDDVLKAIRNLILQANELGVRNFAETPYVEEQNGQTYSSFDMDRDGFALLAMGFTGSAALQWKLRYIEAFNRMEAQLRLPSSELASEVAALRLELAELKLNLGAPKRLSQSPERLVLRLIRDREVMPRGVLSRKVDGRLTVEQIDSAVEALFEAGQIEIIQGRTHDRVGGRPATYYAAIDF